MGNTLEYDNKTYIPHIDEEVVITEVNLADQPFWEYVGRSFKVVDVEVLYTAALAHLDPGVWLYMSVENPPWGIQSFRCRVRPDRSILGRLLLEGSVC